MGVDYCLKSRAVFLGDAEKAVAGCVLIEGSYIKKVVAYGEEKKYLDSHTVVLDYGNQLIMPGFIDAHTHFFSGALAASSHVCGEISRSKSEEECVRMMLDFYAKHPNEKRLRGRGWFVTNWGDAPLPTKRSLDAAFPNIPVYMQAADCHSYWLNSKALEECGIFQNPDGSLTTDVEGVERFPDGEPSGMLLEMDACLEADRLYHDFLPEENLKIYEGLVQRAASFGITSMSEMMPYDYDKESRERYALVQRLEREGKLTVRLHIFPKLYDVSDFGVTKRLQKEFDSNYIRISGVKGFIDGVTETYTGLLLKPYENRPDTCGIGVPVKSQEELNEAVRRANAQGLPVRIHCIADGSVRMALAAFACSVRENGMGLANCIEHIENIHPDDIPKFKELGVIPSMQPVHLLLDAGGKLSRIGEERVKWEWPLRSILESCKELALGTDYPVVDMNPFVNIYAAVARKYTDGTPAGFNPEERLTMGQTLRAYTFGAAAAYGRRNEIGALKEGMLADVIVIDRDLFHVEEREILDSRVTMTMSGGKIVYEAAKVCSSQRGA